MAPSQRKVLWPPNLSPRPYDGYDPRDGQSVLFVPLGRSGVTAHIDKEDYERLIAAGVSRCWRLVRNSAASAYVRAPASREAGNAVTVARVLLNAGAGQKVCYRDRDPKNLRRDNLFIDKGYARRKDADLTEPPATIADTSNATHGHREGA